MSQEFDLTKEVKSFSAAKMPVILRSVDDDPTAAGQIVAFQMNAFGGAKLSDKPGVLELLSTLMARGTYNYSKEKIDQIFTRTGADFSISAGNDAMTVSLKCLKKYLPELLPIISEMLRVPRFEESEIKLAKDQLVTSLKGELEHPDSILSLEMAKHFYQGHPYSNRPQGYLDTIPQIKRDDLTTALFKAFNKSNLLIVVVGPVNQEETSGLVEKYFSSVQEGNRSADITEKINNDTSKIFFDSFDAPTSYFMSKFKAPSLESPDYPALAIGMQILDSRLFDEVRTKRALTYAVAANLGNSMANSGTLYVTSTDLPKAVDVMLEEVKKMQIEDLDPQTIELQVRKFLSGWYLGRETRTIQASILALYEIMGIGWEQSNTFIHRLEQVKPEDIKRVMRDYLKDFTSVVVGPKEVDLIPVFHKYGFMLGAQEASGIQEESPAGLERATGDTPKK